MPCRGLPGRAVRSTWPHHTHCTTCTRLAAGDCDISSRDADGLFRRIARESGAGLLLRWLLWTGVRWGALANPARRADWGRDAPAVTAISLLLLAAAGLTVRGLDHLTHLIF